MIRRFVRSRRSPKTLVVLVAALGKSVATSQLKFVEILCHHGAIFQGLISFTRTPDDSV